MATCPICAKTIQFYEDRKQTHLLDKVTGRGVNHTVHTSCSHEMGMKALVVALQAVHSQKTGPYAC